MDADRSVAELSLTQQLELSDDHCPGRAICGLDDLITDQCGIGSVKRAKWTDLVAYFAFVGPICDISDRDSSTSLLVAATSRLESLQDIQLRRPSLNCFQRVLYSTDGVETCFWWSVFRLEN